MSTNLYMSSSLFGYSYLPIFHVNVVRGGRRRGIGAVNADTKMLAALVIGSHYMVESTYEDCLSCLSLYLSNPVHLSFGPLKSTFTVLRMGFVIYITWITCKNTTSTVLEHQTNEHQL